MVLSISSEQVGELQGFVELEHTFPTFSACADPTVSYAYDLNDQEDGDCYGEMINELDKSIERSKHGYHHKNNKDKKEKPS